jgi:hypothetical protein
MSFYEKLIESKTPNNILFADVLNKSLDNVDRELKEELLNKLSENFLKVSKKMRLKADYSEKKIKGFEGPFINQYLKGMCPSIKYNKFKKLNEAIEAAKQNIYCSGITMTRQGIFTLRFGKVLKDSDKTNKFKNKEITWVKEEDLNLVKDKGQINEKFEIIIYQGKEYYYNIKTRIGINIQTKNVYIFKGGKFEEL